MWRLSANVILMVQVLADHVGIPCRLVKGSHYTGTDEGAVNIVKLDSERLETVIGILTSRCQLFFCFGIILILIMTLHDQPGMVGGQ